MIINLEEETLDRFAINIRVFCKYSTPLQGVREQLILNRLICGLPTFVFAGATIWWFKLFFFFYKMPVHFYMHLFQ